MALVDSALKDAMLGSTEGATDGTAALTDLGDAISGYITDELLAMFSWVGTNPGPPPVPDPVVVTTGVLDGFEVKLSPSGATAPGAGLVVMQTQIITAMTAAVINVGADAGFSLSPVPMAAAPALSSLVLNVSGVDNREDAFGLLALQIVTWVKTLIVPAPATGSHAAFVGAATMTSIV